MKPKHPASALLRAEIVILSLVGLTSAPGCSWIFTRPAPSNHESLRSFDCSTSLAPPVLDTVLTVTNVAAALHVATKDDVANQGRSVFLGLSVAALWALSAHYGHTKTSQCAAAKTYRRPENRSSEQEQVPQDVPSEFIDREPPRTSR